MKTSTKLAKTKGSSSRKKPRPTGKISAKRQQTLQPARASGTRNKATPAAAPHPRQSKQAEVIALLRRPEGVTVGEIVSATGWQPHTVRGLFSGTLKKKLGLTLGSASEEGRGRVYRIADTGVAGAAVGTSD